MKTATSVKRWQNYSVIEKACYRLNDLKFYAWKFQLLATKKSLYSSKLYGQLMTVNLN